MSNPGKDIKRVCVFGTGGVGGYFGAQMSTVPVADQEQTLIFIARGRQLEAIRQNGLRLHTPDRDYVATPDLTTDDPDAIPACDLVLLCVKAYDLDTAVKALAPKVGSDTIVMPLLNGADIYERIRRHLQNGVVLPGCVYVATHIESPGIIRQNGGDGVILCGADPQYPDYDPAPLQRYFDDRRIRFQWQADPYPAIWTKFLFIAAYALVSVYADQSFGQMRTDAESMVLVRCIMTEIVAIAQKQDIRLPKTVISEAVAKANGFAFEAQTSYLRDVRQKGSLNEGDLYGGTIIRLGRTLSVPTPVTASIYGEIQQRLS